MQAMLRGLHFPRGAGHLLQQVEVPTCTYLSRYVDTSVPYISRFVRAGAHGSILFFSAYRPAPASVGLTSYSLIAISSALFCTWRFVLWSSRTATSGCQLISPTAFQPATSFRFEFVTFLGRGATVPQAQEGTASPYRRSRC